MWTTVLPEIVASNVTEETGPANSTVIIAPVEGHTPMAPRMEKTMPEDRGGTGKSGEKRAEGVGLSRDTIFLSFQWTLCYDTRHMQERQTYALYRKHRL